MALLSPDTLTCRLPSSMGGLILCLIMTFLAFLRKELSIFTGLLEGLSVAAEKYFGSFVHQAEALLTLAPKYPSSSQQAQYDK